MPTTIPEVGTAADCFTLSCWQTKTRLPLTPHSLTIFSTKPIEPLHNDNARFTLDFILSIKATERIVKIFKKAEQGFETTFIARLVRCLRQVLVSLVSQSGVVQHSYPHIVQTATIPRTIDFDQHKPFEG